jgi:TetR/AcrR family transcriptional regulator, acrAB operon repressor
MRAWKGFSRGLTLHTLVNVCLKSDPFHDPEHHLARRTKEEALVTREKLLDAAEHLFQAQGVSHTSLQDIAQQAGTTRGAVYWHFQDKADLFNAMLERVMLPLEVAFGIRPTASSNEMLLQADPVEGIRVATLAALQQIAQDGQTRRVLEVATQKVEYTSENQAIRSRHLAVRDGFIECVRENLQLAVQRRGIALPASALVAARGFHALIDGLIQNWLLEPEAFDLLKVGGCAMNFYLAGLGLPHAAAAPTSAAD